MLIMWTVYDHPRDFPNNFVARRWLITAAGPKATDDVVVMAKLDSFRAAMQRCGRVCLPRRPNDDPVILEVWL